MKNLDEKLATGEKKSKFQGKKWFLLSYLIMIIGFVWGCSLLVSTLSFAIGLAPLGGFILAFFQNLIKAIYIIYPLMGFILGRVLKKRSLYLAKGFTYASITIIVFYVIFYVVIIL